MNARTIKAIRAIHKALDLGRFILLSFFALMWFIVGMGILFVGDFHVFNIVGMVGCFAVAAINWSIRRD